MGSTRALQLACAIIFFLQPATTSAQTASNNGASWVYEVRLGVAAHDVDGLWSGERYEDGFDTELELVLANDVAQFWDGAVRPNLGVSINNREYTSQAYAGLLWNRPFDGGWFFNTGVGLSIHNGERETRRPDEKQLGSRVLFRIPFEFGLTFADRHSVSLTFDHVSNAGLADENEGLDTVGVLYGYRF